MKIETQLPKTYGMMPKIVLRGMWRAINAEINKIKIFKSANLNLYLKELEKRITKPKVSRRKKAKKSQGGINEIEKEKNNRKDQCNKELF